MSSILSAKRGLLLMATTVAAAFALIAISPITSANASGAEEFCNGYNAAGYGSPGDRCGASTYAIIWFASGWGYDHSACVDLLNTSNQLVQGWSCSAGAKNTVQIWPEGSKGCVRAQVRNNAAGTNRLFGAQTWSSGC